jgi:hypothetical protein
MIDTSDFKLVDLIKMLSLISTISLLNCVQDGYVLPHSNITKVAVIHFPESHHVICGIIMNSHTCVSKQLDHTCMSKQLAAIAGFTKFSVNTIYISCVMKGNVFLFSSSLLLRGWLNRDIPQDARDIIMKLHLFEF